MITPIWASALCWTVLGDCQVLTIRAFGHGLGAGWLHADNRDHVGFRASEGHSLRAGGLGNSFGNGRLRVCSRHSINLGFRARDGYCLRVGALGNRQARPRLRVCSGHGVNLGLGANNGHCLYAGGLVDSLGNGRLGAGNREYLGFGASDGYCQRVSTFSHGINLGCRATVITVTVTGSTLSVTV